jgi:RNA polymerase sigma-70 factor (ECF subfamily)
MGAGMSQSTDGELTDLLAAAKAGCRESLGKLLDRHANYLRIVVESRMDRRLQPRLSASDVVQQAFCEAHRDLPNFRGSTPVEFAAWLRAIAGNNVLAAIEQNLQAEKRDVRREIPIEGLTQRLEESAARLDKLLAASTATPSEDAVRNERELLLADALAELPSDYRQVIVLRQVEGLPFEEIGQRMDRSSGAVRMLWLRALRSLREALTNIQASGTWV